jgi:hypothetical protein
VAGLLISVFAASTGLLAEDAKQKEKWIQLFNGKDLTGWKVKIRGHKVGENFGNTFRVEQGVLKVAYDGYEKFGEKFGHIFHEREFSSYKLRVEYRFTGEQVPEGPGWAFRNSGLMLHGQTPESMGVDQKFPASIEVQLLGGPGKGTRHTGNLCTPGTNVVMNGKLIKRHCTNSKSKTYHGDQWVTAIVEIRGNSVKHIINGETVLEYTDPQLDERDGDAKKLLAAGKPKMLRRGTISLQSESHPVEFRKVEILELDDPGATEIAKGAWLEPFEGGDLSKHWVTKGNWKLDDKGVVTLKPRKGERGWRRFDSYLWLNGTYSDFEIEFDYKVEKRGNSGFYFHVGDRKSPVAKGIEVQIYDTPSRGPNAKPSDHDSGGIIPGIPPTANSAKPAGEWNRFHIVSKGKDLTVKLNGVVVNKVKLGQNRLKGRPASGSIGFQDNAMPLALRNLRIRKL